MYKAKDTHLNRPKMIKNYLSHIRRYSLNEVKIMFKVITVSKCRSKSADSKGDMSWGHTKRTKSHRTQIKKCNFSMLNLHISLKAIMVYLGKGCYL